MLLTISLGVKARIFVLQRVFELFKVCYGPSGLVGRDTTEDSLMGVDIFTPK